MKDVSKSLIPEYDWLPILIAFDLFRIKDKVIHKGKSSVTTPFLIYFYDKLENDVIKYLTEFVEIGIIKEVRAYICKVNKLDHREEILELICNRDNLIYESLLGDNDFLIPFIKPYELNKYLDDGCWIDFELDIDFESIGEWLDKQLDLFKADQTSRGGYKYDKQKTLFDDRLKMLLGNFVSKGLKFLQFKPHMYMILPLLVYEEFKKGNLAVSQIAVLGMDKKLLFVIDVINEAFLSKASVKLSFDSTYSVLVINGYEIQVKPFGQQYYLLDTVFEDITKLWKFSDIKDSIEGEDDLEDLGKWYHVGYAINVAVERKTKGKISRLFKLTRNSITINKDYI